MSHLEIEEFQRRRRSWRRRTIPFVVLALFGIAFGVATTRYDIGLYIGVLGGVGCSYFTWQIYRCPRCNSIPMSFDDVALNPESCEKCGATLRANG